MKSKVVLSVLAAMGILALSATVAQAGSGGNPTTLLGFFVCHETDGDDPGRTFDVESPVFGPIDAAGNPIRQSVKIGKGSLACAFAKLFPPRTRRTPEPDPIEPVPADQMTCYPLSNSNKGKVKPTPLYDVFGDPLVGDQVDVPVSPTRLQFLCAPAGYFQFQ